MHDTKNYLTHSTIGPKSKSTRRLKPITIERISNEQHLKHYLNLNQEIDFVIQKHDKYIGYNKRFHTPVSPRTIVEKLSNELPKSITEQIKMKLRSENSKELEKQVCNGVERLTNYTMSKVRKIPNKFQEQYNKIFLGSFYNSQHNSEYSTPVHYGVIRKNFSIHERNLTTKGKCTILSENEVMMPSKIKASFRKNLLLIKQYDSLKSLKPKPRANSLSKKEREDHNALKEKIISKQNKGCVIPKEWIDLIKRKLKIDLGNYNRENNKKAINATDEISTKTFVHNKEDVKVKNRRPTNKTVIAKTKLKIELEQTKNNTEDSNSSMKDKKDKKKRLEQEIIGRNEKTIIGLKSDPVNIELGTKRKQIDAIERRCLDKNSIFYKKYLRHTLLNKLDPKINEEYKKFFKTRNEIPLGSNFLKRMNFDIKKRHNNH